MSPVTETINTELPADLAAKRQPQTLRADAGRLASLIDQLSRRWGDDDRKIMSRVLRDWADDIVGTGKVAEARQ